jgi:hypothetical protein
VHANVPLLVLYFIVSIHALTSKRHIPLYPVTPWFVQSSEVECSPLDSPSAAFNNSTSYSSNCGDSSSSVQASTQRRSLLPQPPQLQQHDLSSSMQQQCRLQQQQQQQQQQDDQLCHCSAAAAATAASVLQGDTTTEVRTVTLLITRVLYSIYYRHYCCRFRNLHSAGLLHCTHFSYQLLLLSRVHCTATIQAQRS